MGYADIRPSMEQAAHEEAVARDTLDARSSQGELGPGLEQANHPDYRIEEATILQT